MKNRKTVTSEVLQLITRAKMEHHKHPSNEVDQWKYRKVGRNPGICKTSSMKQLRLIPLYMSRKNMVMIGVILSRLPAKVRSVAKHQVAQMARRGSTVALGGAINLRMGILSSNAMAANNRGAPAIHCKAAPMQLMKIPNLMIVPAGREMAATTILSSFSTEFDTVVPNNHTVDR